MPVIIQFNSLFINVPNSTAKWPITQSARNNNKVRQHRTQQQSKKQENKHNNSAKAI
jgi:hypothetical protein